MARFERAGRVLMWLALAVSLFFQVTTLIGLFKARDNGSQAVQGLITAIILCCAAMTLGAVLVQAMQKFPWIGLALTVVGGFAMIFVALKLRDANPYDAITRMGISTGKMIYRHMICALVPVFAAVASVGGYLARKELALAAMTTAHRPLGDKPIFKDDDSTLGL